MKTCFRLSLLVAALFWVVYQPTIAQPVLNGYAAVTCYSGGVAGNAVVALLDVRLANLQTLGQNWAPPMSHGPAMAPWDRAHLGEVFGITFDPSGNFYVGATSVYMNSTPGGPGGDGAIYQINGVTGGITTFAALPNNGSGLGNLAWDDLHNQMFVTNFEDGKIYRISAGGATLSTFDPFAADQGSASPAPLGERLWGIGVYNNRVYFAVWNENCNEPSNVSDNQIWSVGLDMVGDFSGSEVLELIVPTLPSQVYSNPVSDISFSTAGRMLLSERTMSSSSTLTPNAHASRVLEFFYSSGAWISTGNVFNIGIPASSGCGFHSGDVPNSAGGNDYAYASYDAQNDRLVGCDEAIWASGDVLSVTPQWIYGFQWTPATGGGPSNSVLVDAGSPNKTDIGDIEVYKRCGEHPDPCRNIKVTLNPAPTTMGCCYDITVTGLTAGAFTSISANLITPGAVFTGVIGPAGWNVTNSGTMATWDLNGSIPGGTVTGLRFCLQTQVPPPQQIEVVLHAADGTECRYTFNVNCEPEEPQPCFVIRNEQIKCEGRGPNGWVYSFSFNITNFSPFSQPPYNLPAENVVVYAPGVTITPLITPLVPTLNYGQTSGTLNYTLTSPTLGPGDNICITVQLHGRKLQYDYQWCCPPDSICFDLPPCAECCDSVDITMTHHGVKQVGNTAASISSGSVTVAPGPVTKVQANIMGVSRSRVWCPDPQTGIYAPVAGPTTIGGVITGGSISPVMPVSSGFVPPTAEVIWGTVYGGVNMTGGSINLNLSFPGTSLGWRCQDTLTVCVRYTFTDTACRTCDTVVYYTIPRCGRIDIIAHDPDVLTPGSYGEPVLGEGITIGEPLYSDVVEGPGLALVLSSNTAGRLSLSHWWQDNVIGVDKVRLVRMHVTPEPGIDITRMTPRQGGEGATVTDRTATIGVDLREGETDDFGVEFSNPTSADFFALRVSFDYVDADDPDVELPSREYVVYGDLSGGSATGRIDISQADRSAPMLYKLLIAANANQSGDWVAPACFRFTPPDGVRILASGPMPDSSFAEFHVLKSMSKSISMLLQLPSPGEYRKEYIPEQEDVELWLVLEGGPNIFDLGWEALNLNGEVIGAGSVAVNSTSTVKDGDDYVPGSSIHLLEAWPNPTQEQVTTRFTLGRSERVSVALFDVSGRQVAQVVDDEYLKAGAHEYALNLKSLPNGVYYVRLTTDEGTQTRSVVKK